MSAINGVGDQQQRAEFATLGRSTFTWWRSDTINTERAGQHGEGRWEVATHLDANLIASNLKDREGWHSPVLDIDFPARLVPSSTEGHFHLYLDKPMPWEKYRKLLVALKDAGIIHRKYLEHSELRQATMARPPWVEKIMVPGGFDSSGEPGDDAREPSTDREDREAADAEAWLAEGGVPF